LNILKIQKRNSLPEKIGYLPYLDGLRGIAIIVVMMTHANFQLGIYGIIGVDVFFVLSGFLITTLLLEEKFYKNSVSLKAFFLRRVFRLFPALYLLLLILYIYSTYQASAFASLIQQDIIWSFFYIMNISWIWSTTNSGLINHMWSLAVEEQFYIFWPLILLSLIFLKNIRIMIWGLIIASLYIFISHLYGISELFNSIFQEGIFLGCLIAVLRWRYSFDMKELQSLQTSFLLLIIFIGIAPIPLIILVKEILGGVVSVITAFLVISFVCSTKLTIAKKFLQNNILIFIGKISYALYIWHVPVFFWFKNDLNFPATASFILKWMVSFGLAIFSWYIIEKPSLKIGRSISNKIKQSSSVRTSKLWE
jgi:peptidoglycan/LPS O-acetylase OafA/YrhL